jgi:hypothetical protein
VRRKRAKLAVQTWFETPETPRELSRRLVASRQFQGALLFRPFQISMREYQFSSRRRSRFRRRHPPASGRRPAEGHR